MVKDPTPWESRLKWVNSLDRRLPDEINGPFPNLELEDFKKRLSSVREGIYKWGGQRISEIFVQKMCEQFPEPDLICVNGKKITSISDFCRFVIKGPWDDTMRVIVHYAQDGMWESDNKWSINLEKEIADMLAITWSGESVNPHFTPKRNTEGNCAHHLFVKKKNQVVTRIRDTTRRHWKEAIYARQPVKKDAKKTSKIPKVMSYIKVDSASRGFKGIIGYCEGHAELGTPMIQLGTEVCIASSVDDTGSSLSTPVGCTAVARAESDAMARVIQLEQELARVQSENNRLEEEKKSEFNFGIPVSRYP